MSEPQLFKDYYGINLAQDLAGRIRAVHPAFDGEAFVQAVAERFEPLEMMGRVRLLSECMREHLPADYPQALAILLAALGPPLPDEGEMFNDGYYVLPIAHFVEEYGLEHLADSLPALHTITRHSTSEFAIRPYLERYQDEVLATLHTWASDPSPHVRRLVSEGTRPRLPWGRRLRAFIADPTPTLALLERLKDDPSLYVRRSVANHLNDISKDHPERVLAVLADWLKTPTEQRQWLARHALRTLIKAGHPRALALIGFAPATDLRVDAWSVMPECIRLGQAVTLQLIITNTSAQPQDLLIDYILHLVRGGGKTGAKTFKWTTQTIAPGETLTLSKRHGFPPVTVRRYYSGRHGVTVQINGAPQADTAFDLIVD